MRVLIAIVAAGLFAAQAAQAEMPITYVGRPEIHRFDGSVRQVTLVQPVEESSVPAEKLLPTSEPSSERLIETGAFLKEPLSTEATIHGMLLFHEEPLSLDATPSSGSGATFPDSDSANGNEDVNHTGDRPTGSPFHGMHLADG